MRASSDGWSVTVRALVRRVLTERRYVTPDEAATERACNLTARQWQAAGITTNVFDFLRPFAVSEIGQHRLDHARMQPQL